MFTTCHASLSDYVLFTVHWGSEAMLDYLPKDLDKWIVLENDRLRFNILEPAVTQHGLTQTTVGLDLSSDDVYGVVSDAATFFYHFNHPAISSSILEEGITIEFKKLKSSTDQSDDYPDVPEELNLFQDGVINIEIQKNISTSYGLKVTNKIPLDLYMGLWLLEPGDFDIVDCSKDPHRIQHSL